MDWRVCCNFLVLFMFALRFATYCHIGTINAEWGGFGQSPGQWLAATIILWEGLAVWQRSCTCFQPWICPDSPLGFIWCMPFHVLHQLDYRTVFELRVVARQFPSSAAECNGGVLLDTSAHCWEMGWGWEWWEMGQSFPQWSHLPECHPNDGTALHALCQLASTGPLCATVTHGGVHGTAFRPCQRTVYGNSLCAWRHSCNTPTAFEGKHNYSQGTRPQGQCFSYPFDCEWSAGHWHQWLKNCLPVAFVPGDRQIPQVPGEELGALVGWGWTQICLPNSK